MKFCEKLKKTNQNSSICLPPLESGQALFPQSKESTEVGLNHFTLSGTSLTIVRTWVRISPRPILFYLIKNQLTVGSGESSVYLLTRLARWWFRISSLPILDGNVVKSLPGLIPVPNPVLFWLVKFHHRIVKTH